MRAWIALEFVGMVTAAVIYVGGPWAVVVIVVTATVEVISDTTFNIKWKIGSAVYSGFGMRRGDTLAATYQVNGQPGLIMYTVGDGGVLSGNWSIRGENGSGTDKLTPRN